MRLFEQALRERGLKSTAQRDDIAKVFFGAGEHLSVEELHAAVKKVNPRVGYATVYRTLKLLTDCGLAAARHFDDGQTRYEVADEHHHDHLICLQCGLILEFENDEIEELQEKMAAELGGFRVLRHKHELYCLCPKEQGIPNGNCPQERLHQVNRNR